MAADTAAFDPWHATAEQALQASAACGAGTPDALAQFHAAHQVLDARDACLGSDGGCDVMRYVTLCLVNELLPPQWLRDAFIQRRAMVVGAHVKSWDAPQAFGRPWGSHVQLDRVRRDMQRQKLVHAAVWQAEAEAPGVAINRLLFDRIGEMRGINVCGSKADELYYAALADGAADLAQVRAALRK